MGEISVLATLLGGGFWAKKVAGPLKGHTSSLGGEAICVLIAYKEAVPRFDFETSQGVEDGTAGRLARSLACRAPGCGA